MEAVKDPQRIVTHSQHQNKSLRADFGKWFFWAMFMAASGFVVVFDVLSSVQALENLFVIKILASSLGGVVGFMAAVRSGVFR